MILEAIHAVIGGSGGRGKTPSLLTSEYHKSSLALRQRLLIAVIASPGNRILDVEQVFLKVLQHLNTPRLQIQVHGAAVLTETARLKHNHELGFSIGINWSKTWCALFRVEYWGGSKSAAMSQAEEEVKWTAELEVALFHSMHGHKPVGM